MFSFTHSLALAAAVAFAAPVASQKGGYEIWASDQSNSVANQASLGVSGAFLWIWDSNEVMKQLQGGPDAAPLPCAGSSEGPCDLMDLFPGSLMQKDAGDNDMGLLSNLNGFGRLHGVIADPQNRYVNANIFAPGGGYVGVIDTRTKEAIALFRVTEFQYDPRSDGTRSVHMSFWSESGDAIFVANLGGKAIERINVKRDNKGDITGLSFERSATIGLGKNMQVTESATYFSGYNAAGHPLMGEVVGAYDAGALGDLTPNGVCKENGCTTGDAASMGGRGNNLPICPIPSSNDLIYATLAGGGLFVLDGRTTPMSIKGEYGKEVIFGAGCGGVETRGKMYTNSGVSASGSGATQSYFAVWQHDDDDFMGDGANNENEPEPLVVFSDEGNVGTDGNGSGQLPGTTTRRDSHGAAATINGRYLHVVDRIQNKMEVFNTKTFERNTYDLTSADGQGEGIGPCDAKSITDGDELPLNDPAPDLFERSPDGKFLFIAFRGPSPVSVAHSAQGSCPGVGVVRLLKGGRTGRLVGVLRATNTVPDQVTVSPTGGVEYTGTERSDVHGTIVVDKRGW